MLTKIGASFPGTVVRGCQANIYREGDAGAMLPISFKVHPWLLATIAGSHPLHTNWWGNNSWGQGGLPWLPRASDWPLCDAECWLRRAFRGLIYQQNSYSLS